MNLLWEQLSTAVRNRTGITEGQYNEALEQQKNAIIDFLTFTCFPESEMEAEIAQTKKSILEMYTNEIAPTISKVEVYSHDMEAGAVEAVFNLLQYVASAEMKTDIDKKIKSYNAALSYAYFIKFVMQNVLTELYFNRINEYKKLICNFKHRGVRVQDDTRFVTFVKTKLKFAKRKYRGIYKVYRTYVTFKDGENPCIRIDTIQHDLGFDALLSQLEDIILLYEAHIPEIFDNGYKMPLLYRLSSGAVSLISVLLLIYGFLQYMDLWNHITNFVVQFFK